ncbi:scavenger mRNA decapping enzyme [Phellopilus nigrolimitatus]|nr:scavenger mRNA decapping enzyme [Phellopilus nigrolimitatus]
MSDLKALLENIETLRDFSLERVLNEDHFSHTVTLLGTIPFPLHSVRSQAILRVERTELSGSVAQKLPDILQSVKLIESNDIYSWLLAWIKKHDDVPDVKLNVICPATEVHIRKYSKQSVIIVRETPELYERVVLPFIRAFPPSRTKWVEDILSGVSEGDKILYEDVSPTSGFVLLPDMKWDLTNVSTLYLVALTHTHTIRSLRDLRGEHLPMLKSIRGEATRVVKERWSLEEGGLRFYVHYQPSYYHFHVHIVNANYVGIPSMAVGQAHLLEDIISLIELSPPGSPSLLAQMTLTYGLGEQHGLFEGMKSAQEELGVW